MVQRPTNVMQRLPHRMARMPGSPQMMRPVTPGSVVTSPPNRMPRYTQPAMLSVQQSVSSVQAVSADTVGSTATTTVAAASTTTTTTSPATTTTTTDQLSPTTTTSAAAEGEGTPEQQAQPPEGDLTPKKLSLEQYRSKQLIRGQQPQRILPPQRELLFNAKKQQVLYVTNASRGQMIGNSVSSQHQVVKMQHEQQQCPTPDSTSSDTKEQQKSGPCFVPGHQVVCSNCGILGDDFNTCQRCKKPLPKTARVIPSSTTNASLCLPGPQLVSKQDFYSKSGGGRRQDKPQQYGARGGAKTSQRGRGRGRTRAYDEPEILTLSSDEDGDDSNGSRCKATPPKTPGLQHGGLDTLQGKMATLANKEPVILPADTTDDDPHISMADFNPDTNSCFTKLVCRNVRIGSYRTVPKSGVLFSKHGIRIPMPTIIKDSPDVVEINIDVSEMVKILYHFGKQMPVIFIYAKAVAAVRIRKQLLMEDEASNYYEPTSTDEATKRIIIMPEKLTEESKKFIKSMFIGTEATSSPVNIKPVDDDGNLLLEELSLDEANTILVSASAPEVQAVVRQTAKTVAQMSQPSKTLLIYPFPPQKGGISVTVDDYQVLEEESFLNDVILDFYLIWLLQNKVEEEQRNKVHLFSTFFYKRLTCKPKKMRRHHPVEDDPKLSAAQKRHARVKGWTKLVDIFEKDFVIIPINEHAHWFLAIVCFPGLIGPVDYVSGTPVEQDSALSDCDSNKRRSSRCGPRTEQIPIIDDGEWSDRDEAEGDEDELEDDDDTEDDNDQPTRKKNKSETIPGLESATASKKKSATTPIRQPCILIFDSLSGGHRARIVATLRDYLSVEYEQKHGVARSFTRHNMKGSCPRVPQQTNYSDCGIYTLQFTESFFELPLTDYRFPMRNISNWFDQADVAGKREAIALLIKELMNQYNPNNSIKLPEIYFNTAEEREKGGRASCQVEERERAERLAMEKSLEKDSSVKANADVNNGSTSPSSLVDSQVNHTSIPLIGDHTLSKDTQNKQIHQANLHTKNLQDNTNTKPTTDVKKVTNQDPKKKESSSLNCSSVENKVISNTNNDDRSGMKKTQLPGVSKITKPTLIRPDIDSNSSNKFNQRQVAGESKGKKLVLGSIPVVKPFGTQIQLNKASIKSQESKPAVSQSLGTGLASIRDMYTYDPDQIEDNNNDSDVKQRLSIGSRNVECSVGAQTVTLIRTAIRTVRPPSAVVVEAVQTNTTILNNSLTLQTLPSNTVQSNTLNRTDIAHLSKYPILASSLGSASNNCSVSASSAVLETDKRIDSVHQQPAVLANNKVRSISLDKTEYNITSSDLIDKVSNITKSDTTVYSHQAEEIAPKNGHLNQFVVGEISGKKAVYSEDNSEVYMYLSSEETNSLSQADSDDRDDANSPDIYSDLDINQRARQHVATGDTLADASYANNAKFIENTDEATGLPVSGFLSSVGSAYTDEGAASTGSSSTAPACFRFNERGTASGRVIAPPKRYLDHPTGEVRRKKKARGGTITHR